MPASDLPDRLCTIITEHLDCADRFEWEAELKRDLGADSLDTVELTMAAEEAFDIEIDDRTALAWRTAGDMLATVEERLLDRPAQAQPERSRP